IDPDAVIVVAARRTAEGGERAASVRGLPGYDARRIDDVRIHRIDLDLGEVVGALGDARIVADPCPALPGVVGAVEKATLLRRDGGEEARGARRRDAEADPSEAVALEVRQPAGQRLPGRAAVGRFVQPAARSGELAIFPRRLPGLPEGGVDDARIGGVDDHVGAAGVRVLVEDALEGFSAVDGAEDPALLVWTIWMPEHGDEEAVGILRIDGDLRNLLALPKAKVLPAPPAVDGSVDPVSRGQVGPLQAFAAAHIDDVRVRKRDGDGADASRRLIVEDWRPRPAVVYRPPDAAVDRAHVEDARARRHAGSGLRAPSAEGPDRAPVQFGEQRRHQNQREDHLRLVVLTSRSRNSLYCAMPVRATSVRSRRSSATAMELPYRVQTSLAPATSPCASAPSMPAATA